MPWIYDMPEYEDEIIELDNDDYYDESDQSDLMFAFSESVHFGF